MSSGQRCLLLVFLGSESPRPREWELVSPRCSSKMRLDWDDPLLQEFNFFLVLPILVPFSSLIVLSVFWTILLLALFSCLSSQPQMNLCFSLAYPSFFATSYALAPKAAGQPPVCWSWLALAPERESHASLPSSAFGSVRSTTTGLFTAWRSLKSAKL